MCRGGRRLGGARRGSSEPAASIEFFVCFTGREAEKQRRRIERARSQLHGMDGLLATSGSRLAAE